MHSYRNVLYEKQTITLLNIKIFGPLLRGRQMLAFVLVLVIIQLPLHPFVVNMFVSTFPGIDLRCLNITP